MTDNSVRNSETMQENINRQLTALLNQYVRDGILVEYDRSTEGYWTTLASHGEVRRSIFMNHADLVNYLDGIATAKAYYTATKDAEELDKVHDRLGSLVHRNILTRVFRGASGDSWEVAGPRVNVTYLSSREDALEFLSKYE